VEMDQGTRNFMGTRCVPPYDYQTIRTNYRRDSQNAGSIGHTKKDGSVVVTNVFPDDISSYPLHFFHHSQVLSFFFVLFAIKQQGYF